MRNLQLKDVFTVSRIIKKMKIKPEIKPGMTQEEIGAELIASLIENLGDVEDEILTFLADLKNTNKERLAEMDFEELINLIEEFKELKGLNRFFTQVAKLMK